VYLRGSGSESVPDVKSATFSTGAMSMRRARMLAGCRTTPAGYLSPGCQVDAKWECQRDDDFSVITVYVAATVIVQCTVAAVNLTGHSAYLHRMKCTPAKSKAGAVTVSGA